MSYEYEEINRAIVQQNGIDNNINRGNLLREIDEVYRKARAFDQLAHTYEQYKESHAHDLKSTMGTKAIEIMERVE